MAKLTIPKRTIVTLNVAGGAYVNISPSLPFCRKIEVVECPPPTGVFDNAANAYNPQGTNYKRSDDGFVAILGLAPGDTLRLGEDVSQGSGQGTTIGAVAYTDPSGNVIAQPIVLKMVSATATATQVEVREWN